MRKKQQGKRRILFVALIVFLIGGLAWKYVLPKSINAVDTDFQNDEISSSISNENGIKTDNKFFKNLIDNQIAIYDLAVQKERERIEAERVKKQQEIAQSTYFVKKSSVDVYDDTLENKLPEKLPEKMKLFVSDTKEQDIVVSGEVTGKKVWCCVKSDYESDEILGWVDKDALTNDRTEFIYRIYDGVDYSYFPKTSGYANNPRIEAKGVYVTGHSAGGEKFKKLLELADTTAINTFVIDVRDDNEDMLFYSDVAQKYSPEANRRPYIKDMKAFMDTLKEHNIYIVARIVTFKAPKYAKNNPDKAILKRDTNQLYQSSDGIKWASPYDRTLWEYNIGVAKEAAEYGFNEIQFDYVRFPASAGGRLDAALDYHNDLSETKAEAIQKFLKKAYSELSAMNVYVAADVFGWVASDKSDVGIGQHWEAMTAVVDYMCPMMYPSHYGPGNYGLSVPDAYPYETIDRGIKDAFKRDSNIEMAATLRPWIQDFTAGWVKGHIFYGPAQIKAQIKALEDNGINEYLLWNAANVYTKDGIK